MKKTFAIVLALACVLTLSITALAMGSDEMSPDVVPSAEPAETVGETPAETVEEPTDDEIAAEPVEDPTEDEIAEEPVEEPADEEVAEEPVEEPADEEVAEEPVEEPADEEVVEDPAEEPVESAIPPYDPSEGIPEELWDFCYVVGHFLQWYEEMEDGTYALVIENRGTQDAVVTYYMSYNVIDYASPDFHWGYEEGDVKFGIPGDAPRIKIGSETTTVEIPAGEKAYVFFNQELQNASDGGVGGIIYASYGDAVATQELPG